MGPSGGSRSALGVADALRVNSYALGALFAIALLDASIIGAAAVTLSTSYAFGDVFNLKHSLHRSFRDAKTFYATYAAMIVAAAGIVLIPHAPLGLLTEAVLWPVNGRPRRANGLCRARRSPLRRASRPGHPRRRRR